MESKLLRELESLMRLGPGTLAGPEELKCLSGWDSLAMIEFIALADEEFGIDLAPADVRKCTRVQDLINLAGARVAD